MSQHPVILNPNDKVSTAAGYIMEYRYRTLPIVDFDGRFLGIFSVNCLLHHILPRAALMDKGLKSVHFVNDSLKDLHEHYRAIENEPVSICLKTEVTTVSPDTPLVETLLILHRTRASIPVVEPDTGKLAGMISYFDVGRAIRSA
ncbi:MAG: CBS domain-containing protein [Thiohalobacterales bacterium]|nr:CBS domain-containing protein [Thiohalobacterales bacterium]